jgi:hypothetical protein
MATRRREGQRCDLLPEGEVVEGYPPGDVGEDCAAIFVDGEEEVAARVECQAGNVAAVRERKGM